MLFGWTMIIIDDGRGEVYSESTCQDLMVIIVFVMLPLFSLDLLLRSHLIEYTSI